MQTRKSKNEKKKNDNFDDKQLQNRVVSHADTLKDEKKCCL